MEGNASVFQVIPVTRITGEWRAEFLRIMSNSKRIRCNTACNCRIYIRSLFYFLYYTPYINIFFCTHQLFRFWSSHGPRCRPVFPPILSLQFVSRIRSSILTAHRCFIERLANSRSRDFRESICPQEKLPTNVYEYALGGIRTDEADLLLLLFLTLTLVKNLDWSHKQRCWSPRKIVKTR